MRGRHYLALLLLVVLALLPATAGGAPGRVPQNVLVIGRIIGDVVSLDPAEAFELTSTWIDEHLYETLVEFSRDFTRAVPGLATSWTVSADGKAYTFTLRSGVKFHSGNAVDAKAVEFSLRRAMRLKLQPAFILTGFIKNPEDVVAISANQVRITFNQVMPEILMTCVLSNPVASAVDPALVQKNATASDPLANKWVAENDAGSGPYVLRRWTRNAVIELVAFDDYWGGRPRMGRIFVQDIPEPTAQLLALQRGDVDMVTDLLPAQFVQAAKEAGLVVKTSPQFALRYLAMNVGYEPFSRVQVRNAVKWAIDYTAFRRIFEDQIDIGQTIVPARMFGHLPDRPYSKNLDRARALMREAGFERGFKAELLTVPDPPLPDIAAKIKEDLAQIGIEVEVKVLRSADILAAYRARTHQMVIARWGADYPDPDNLATALADFDARVLAYRNQWDHPIKRTVQQAVQELDRAKRDAMYRQIQKVVLDEGPYVIIGYPLRLLAMRANVKGLDPSPLSVTYGMWGVVKE
ncbi:MAG: dipeptide ABC transporter periplasmic protein [Armatimonadetes bacterium CSP1-3]|nr:MAG: dipeptide ABC transporter periplasmic protein [Armatimonadetes bacterium CSP1-3]